MNDNTKRFSDRVEDYIKYRPDYPEGILKLLEEEIGLNNSQTIADIGSGTGISSQLFLEKGYLIYCVEPNKEMREAAEKSLSVFPNFKSVNGTAEKTNLPSESVDLIFCAQAFHWFDKEKSRVEFDRILKKNAHIVLVWNSRSTNSKFQTEYEKALFDYCPEYKSVNHRNITDEEISNFFAPEKMNKFCLDHQQILTLDGLKGRVASSSYCPKKGKQHDELMRRMEDIFEKYQEHHTIKFKYETQVFWC